MTSSVIFWTILIGITIFVCGQIILKLVIEPVAQFKRTMADIAHTLIRYAHALHNTNLIQDDLHRETYNRLRMLSGQLYGDMKLIPLYWLYRVIFFLPSKSNVYKAAKNLLAISNWMGGNNPRSRYAYNSKYSEAL